MEARTENDIVDEVGNGGGKITSDLPSATYPRIIEDGSVPGSCRPRSYSRAAAKTAKVHLWAMTAFLTFSKDIGSFDLLVMFNSPLDAASRRMIPVRAPPISRAAMNGNATVKIRRRLSRKVPTLNVLGVDLVSLALFIVFLLRGEFWMSFCNLPKSPTRTRVPDVRAHVSKRLSRLAGSGGAGILV